MDISDALKAINNPARMNFLHWLKTPSEHFDVDYQYEIQQVKADEMGICAVLIQRKSGLSQSTVSAYLAALQRANLITSTRIGGYTYYKRNEAHIDAVTTYLKENL